MTRRHEADVNLGRRIMVVGTSGSGKSHVAQSLARALDIPYICNDAIIWGPNWTPTPKPQRYECFEAATRVEAWTFDGNVGSLADREDLMILQRADTVVWLDLPRRVVMRQIILRTLGRALLRTPLWHGNRESIRSAVLSRESMIVYAWKTYAVRRRQYAAIFADACFAHLRRIRLTSRRQVNRWLAAVAHRPGVE